jgi:hypothetical protein
VQLRWAAVDRRETTVKTIRSLAPLAVGLAILGFVIAWLLNRHIAAGEWLFAGVLVGHGWVHAMFAMPRPPAKEADAAGAPEWPFDMGESWLVSRAGIGANAVRVVGLIVIAVVAIGFLLAGLATVGIVVPAGAWPGLVATSAIASAVLLALFFSPQLVLGLAIDAILLVVVAASIWSPATAG